MIDWWYSLDFSKQLFYGVGIVALFLMLFELLLSLIGIGGHSLDLADAGGSMDHGTGLGLLSFRTLTAFFTGFGWAGGIAMTEGLGLGTSVAIATASGTGLMFAIYWVMVLLMRMQSSGTLDLNNAIGSSGAVYMRIPPSRTGAGKIEVLVQGRLAILDAYTDETEEIRSQVRVEVVGTVGGSALLVAPTHKVRPVV